MSMNICKWLNIVAFSSAMRVACHNKKDLIAKSVWECSMFIIG